MPSYEYLASRNEHFFRIKRASSSNYRGRWFVVRSLLFIVRSLLYIYEQ